MSLDEGYIKYDCDWTPGPPVDASLAAAIDAWRKPLNRAGFIGEYKAEGIGFGNISMRPSTGREFLITATQTGHLDTTDGNHYAWVRDWNIAENSVSCEGPLRASSESLTHAAIYAADPSVGAIVHGHHPALWEKLRGRIPTTAAEVAYGTPEMAIELGRLLQDKRFARDGVAAMAGHEHGLVSIGASLEIASTRMLNLARHLRPAAPA